MNHRGVKCSDEGSVDYGDGSACEGRGTCEEVGFLEEVLSKPRSK